MPTSQPWIPNVSELGACSAVMHEPSVACDCGCVEVVKHRGTKRLQSSQRPRQREGLAALRRWEEGIRSPKLTSMTAYTTNQLTSLNSSAGRSIWRSCGHENYPTCVVLRAPCVTFACQLNVEFPCRSDETSPTRTLTPTGKRATKKASSFGRQLQSFTTTPKHIPREGVDSHLLLTEALRRRLCQRAWTAHRLSRNSPTTKQQSTGPLCREHFDYKSGE